MGLSGNITSYIDFHDAINSAPINQRFINRFPTGIYYGADLGIVSNTSASVSAFDLEITDGTYLMKATSSSSNNVTVSNTNIWVVARWSYTGSANDVPSLLGVSSVATNDIVIGKCIYSGSTLNGFDLTSRSSAQSFSKFCLVEPTNPANLSIKVRAGNISSSTQSYSIPEQVVTLSLSGGGALSVGQSVVAVVTINTSGAIAVLYGTPVVTGSQTAPAFGGNFPLAQITLSYGQSTINTANIVDARGYFTFPVSSTLIIPSYSGADPGSPVVGQIWLRSDI